MTPQRQPRLSSETEVVGEKSFDKLAWETALAVAPRNEKRPDGEGWLTISELLAQLRLNNPQCSRNTLEGKVRRGCQAKPPTIEKAMGADISGHATGYYRPARL